MSRTWVTFLGPPARDRLYVSFTLQQYESSFEGLIKGRLDRVTTVCASDSVIDLWFMRWIIKVHRIVVVIGTGTNKVGISTPLVNSDGIITGYLLYLHLPDREQRRIYRLSMDGYAPL